MTTILGIDPVDEGRNLRDSPRSPRIEIWRMPKSDRALVDLLQMFDPATTRVYRERIRWRRWKPNHGGWNQPLWIRLQAAWQRAMKERTP